MSRTIELSDKTFKALQEAAERRGETPEALIELLILAAHGPGQERAVYDDLDAFFRSFGASEEEITESERLFREREQPIPANPS